MSYLNKDNLAGINISNEINCELENILKQLVKFFPPQCVYLFGSRARGDAREKSDIDLCVVIDIDETQQKKDLLTEIYLKIDTKKPFDLVIYSPEEWETLKHDQTSFAYLIYSKGVKIYGW